MKTLDYCGNELVVGDEIAYIANHYRELATSKITRIAKSGKTVYFDAPRYAGDIPDETNRMSNTVVKVNKHHDFKQNQELREQFKKETGKAYRATESDIALIEDCQIQNSDGTWESIEMDWAEWDYAIWLEKQILANKQ